MLTLTIEIVSHLFSYQSNVNEDDFSNWYVNSYDSIEDTYLLSNVHETLFRVNCKGVYQHFFYVNSSRFVERINFSKTIKRKITKNFYANLVVLFRIV